MTPERWTEVRAAVEAALLVPLTERDTYLRHHIADDEVRSEAERLLRSQPDASRIFPVDAWRDEAAQTAPQAEQTVGNYRLLRELGRGGMGAVYLAERADGAYQQHVAVKIIQERVFTPALEERFLEERQILAGLTHRGIARLLDGGVTADGRPYLVLEYVDGVPVDQYCADRQLDTEAKLRLFLQVAAAVQSAHQQLVLHLDLKPANILITGSGEARLLDFGIARILPEIDGGALESEATLRILTPRYASPEQAEGGRLGVASDVFSLTTLLYRILTGTLPYPLEGATLLEAARILREVQPTPPGRLDPRLRGDLELILLKGLRKEPARRYPTVAALAGDVERYLRSEPVLAHPDSTGYSLRKFTVRHRSGVLAALAMLLIILGSLAAVARSAVAARRAERLAQQRLRDERDLAHSYVFELEPMLQNIPGTVKVRAFILQNAMRYLDAISHDIGNDDDLAQEVSRGYMGFGQVQADAVEPSLGDRAAAWRSMERASQIQSRLVERRPGDLKPLGFLVLNLRLMSFLAGADGDVERSDAYSTRALQLAQPILDAGPTAPRYMTVASVLWDLANNRAGNGGSWNFGDPTAALPYLDRMHAMLLRLDATGDPKSKANAGELLHREFMSRASVYRDLGSNSEARAQYESALSQWKAQPTRTLTEMQSLRVIQYNYADFLLGIGDAKAAAAMAPALPDTTSREAGADRSQQRDEADILGLLGRIDLRLGRLGPGRDKMNRSLNIYEAIYKEDPSDITSTAELSSTCFDFASEPALDRATRARLYRSSLEVTKPYRDSHPTVYSVLLEQADAALGLATLASAPDASTHMGKMASDATGRNQEQSVWAALAVQAYRSVLSVHPRNPVAERNLKQAEALVPATATAR